MGMNNMPSKTFILLISSLLLFSTSPLLAHTGDAGAGVLGLLLHPLTGLDHILMTFLVAVGIVGVYHWRRKRKG